MILFESPLIRLDYTPATDILLADLLGAHEFHSLEIRETFNIIATTVRHYDVKRLLMDSRNRHIAIDEVAYSALMQDYVNELGNTRLQKLARLKTLVDFRENLAKQNQAAALTFAIATFKDKEQAIEWLLS